MFLPTRSVELFPYRGAAKDLGTLEYLFEAGEQDSPNDITTEKAEDRRRFSDDFYGLQVGALATQGVSHAA
jgi:hypothetical protein